MWGSPEGGRAARFWAAARSQRWRSEENGLQLFPGPFLPLTVLPRLALAQGPSAEP